MTNPCWICSTRGLASSLHIVLALLFIKLTFLLGSCILVLLILRHQVVHVRLGLGKLHFVHSLAGVPVKKSLAAEHCREVFSNTLEHLLDGCGVAQESDRHLQALWRNVTDGALHVVRDPLYEV